MTRRIRSDDITVTIDIGTTKICVLIAHTRSRHDWEIIGTGHAESRGLERGCVVNVQEAVAAITYALEEAQEQAGLHVESAYIGISGAHIHATTSTGMVAVQHGEIHERDTQRVIESAKTVPLDDGEQILHAIAQEYTIDGHYHVHNPTGMRGIRLEAHVHIITGGVSFVHNLVQCCTCAGIKVKDIILEPLASADAVLSKDEQALGVGLLDIGGGTADFAMYYHDTIRHTRIFPIGGTLFTNDTAVCLQTTRKEADRLKHAYGSVNPHDAPAELVIRNIDDQTMRTISGYALTEVLHARSHELIEMVGHEIQANIPRSITPSGLVITGGGSQLCGLDMLASHMLGMPCRIGYPHTQEGSNSSLHTPTFATSYGLLMHVLRQDQRPTLDQISGSLTQRIAWKMKSWLSDFI